MANITKSETKLATNVNVNNNNEPKKGNPLMSTTSNKAENIAGAANNFWTNGFGDTIRDLVGLQVRTAQLAVDKSVSFGQSVSDFYQNHLGESIKLSQEYAKYGWGNIENLKKTAYELTDRTFRSFNA